MKETLECGHKQAVYPTEGETFTARKRSCHECLKEFVQAVESKKPVQGIVRAAKRKAAGNGIRELAFASAAVIILVFAAHLEKQRTFIFQAPADKFQILKRFDAYNYQFRKIHTEHGRITTSLVHAKFCNGYEPPLSAGETLTRLAYIDMGSCWFIESKGLGYDFEIDARGHNTLAPNCHEGQRIVECSPNLTEADFGKEQ